ncbi:MAG: hypothetical protein IIA17_07705 [candidate division Zixibacteria bacterium]|nr:hypothetical protein [candidate division Zixibacteria bacterium]
MFNRNIVLSVWERFTRSQGWPNSIIFDDEPEFEVLLNFMKSRSSIDSVRNDTRIPSAVARLGGTITPPMIGDVSENWPKFHYAIETSPLIFLYDYQRSTAKRNDSADSARIQYVCTLGELQMWVEESRNKERFWIAAILVNFLSLTIFFLTNKSKEKID